MRPFTLTLADLYRGIVAVTLIALAMGIVAPVSLTTALVMVVGGVTLAATGTGRPSLAKGSN